MNNFSAVPEGIDEQHYILAVDNNPDNLLVIADCLKSTGYKLLVAQDGESALEKASYAMPDLILLDILMPGMNGFETCRRLKSIPNLHDIPVIFMTALHEVTEKVKGFELGAVDYITKPFQSEELTARVNTHLSLRIAQKQLAKAHDELELKVKERTMELAKVNENLENKVSQRTEELSALNQELTAMNEELTAINEELLHTNQELLHEIDVRQRVEQELAAVNKELTQAIKEQKAMQARLIQSEKMAALGNLVAGIAHEINTPVGIGVTAASHLSQTTGEFLKLCQNGSPRRSDLAEYLENLQDSSSIILKNLERAGKLIKSFKQISADQSSEIRRVFNIKTYLEEILLSLRPKLGKSHHHLVLECADEIQFDGVPGAFSQIVTNLLMNSLLHAYDPDDCGKILISAKEEAGSLVLIYSDDGKGMDYQVLTRIYDPFFTTKRSSGGTGLGLYIVYNVVTQQFGGSIECTSELGNGTTFRICLPIGGKTEVE